MYQGSVSLCNKTVFLTPKVEIVFAYLFHKSVCVQRKTIGRQLNISAFFSQELKKNSGTKTHLFACTREYACACNYDVELRHPHPDVDIQKCVHTQIVWTSKHISSEWWDNFFQGHVLQNLRFKVLFQVKILDT